MHLKMAEALGTVHTLRRGLLRGWWWRPIGPKLAFDQMVAPVPEIMDDSLYTIVTNLEILLNGEVSVIKAFTASYISLICKHFAVRLF
jgi:hypothetical protein